MQHLSLADKEALYAFLQAYLTPHKRALFEEVLRHRTRHITVAVEDLHKEQNASAVVRTCDCFGVQDIHIIEEENPYQVSHTIALGADQWLDIHLYDQSANNTQTCIDHLKQQGYRIVATTPHERDHLLADFDLRQPAAIFFGGELKGLSQQVLAQADTFLKIPLYGFTESFNISASAAIILHDLTARLRKQDIAWQLSPDDQLDIKIRWAKQTIKNGETVANHFLKKYFNK